MRIIKKTGDVYTFLNEIKQDKVFSFTSSKSIPPGQPVKLQYCEDQPTPWTVQYGTEGYPIHNIQKWIWDHQKDINNRIRDINKTV